MDGISCAECGGLLASCTACVLMCSKCMTTRVRRQIAQEVEQVTTCLSCCGAESMPLPSPPRACPHHHAPPPRTQDQATQTDEDSANN